MTKPTTPRTCCDTHNDRCKFGRQHVWFIGIYDETGAFRVDLAQCGTCGSLCTAEEPSA